MVLSGAPIVATKRLDELLDAGLASRPDEPALVSHTGATSYRDLDRQAGALARAYLAQGLEPGDRIVSLMPNRALLFAHYLACQRAGLVATPLNYRYTPPEIDHALSVSEARAVVAHRERDADLAASRAGALPIIRFDDEGGGDLARLAAGPPLDAALAAVESAPAAIFFTSGSTGPAKGVTHTRASLAAIFSSAAQSFRLAASDVVLPASSCSHIGGFACAMAGLSVGASVAVARSFDHVEIGPLLLTTRPSMMSMLPATLLTLIREHDMGAAEFASLRLIRSAGDKVPDELEKELFARAGKRICEGYGMTEFGLAAINAPEEPGALGSVGRASPGFSFSIRDASGAEAAPEIEGRLWAKTPTQSCGYWRDEAATREVMRDGWFDTGDVMKSDAEGRLWFCGRAKQIIVHDGSNISPQEVEDALLEHPDVAGAGVIGVHDMLHGETVRAYVTLRQEAPAPTAGELIAFARARVGYKAPEQIVVLDEMPMNATGKVDRAALKRLAAADHAHIR
ncbi:MAG: class I adenylate-forming enzyme family protein [Methylocystis sp.]